MPGVPPTNASVPSGAAVVGGVPDRSLDVVQRLVGDRVAVEHDA